MMLDVLNLRCHRGTKRLFDDLTFHLERGQSLLVCGANGSGKTTLLRALSGLAMPLSGEIRWNDAPIERAAFARQVFYLDHRNALKDDLTLIENLEMAVRLADDPFDRGLALAALERMGLTPCKTLSCACLSAGQKRRAALARLLLSNRPLWLLDEPFAALDSHAIETVALLINAHRSNAGIVIVSSPRETEGMGVSFDQTLCLDFSSC